jgi:hypothetical protein
VWQHKGVVLQKTGFKKRSILLLDDFEVLYEHIAAQLTWTRWYEGDR